MKIYRENWFLSSEGAFNLDRFYRIEVEDINENYALFGYSTPSDDYGILLTTPTSLKLAEEEMILLVYGKK